MALRNPCALTLKTKNDDGFTLMEILVVVVIIGLLASIADDLENK